MSRASAQARRIRQMKAAEVTADRIIAAARLRAIARRGLDTEASRMIESGFGPALGSHTTEGATMATTTRPGLSPVIPAVGHPFHVFGLTAVVTIVEPQDDYLWRVEAVIDGLDRDVHGEPETIVVLVPTDYRTTDGVYAYAD